MRHNKKFNHLSRKKGHREALLSNLAIALIQHINHDVILIITIDGVSLIIAVL